MPKNSTLNTCKNKSFHNVTIVLLILPLDGENKKKVRQLAAKDVKRAEVPAGDDVTQSKQEVFKISSAVEWLT